MEYLPFEGTVSLKSPQHIFCLLEDYGTDPNNIPEHPNYIYFGRWVRYSVLLVCIWIIRWDDLQLDTFHLYTLLHQIADGQRELIRSHSVKNRHFIGNTTMDAGLSFIMANHAKVKENDLVFDPFVGTGEMVLLYTCISTDCHTFWEICVSKWFQSGLFLSSCVSGSLLVACSQFGAYVCGTDIDYNTIHGKGNFVYSELECHINCSRIFKDFGYLLSSILIQAWRNCFRSFLCSEPAVVPVFQAGRAVKTRSGEDLTRISEPTCGSMEQRGCM